MLTRLISSLCSSVLDKFYSSSDSDSDDEIERKIHVEIKPLNNGTDKISASVDELRATVENLSLSPIGVLSVINLDAALCVLLRCVHFLSAFIKMIKRKKSNHSKASFIEIEKKLFLVSVAH
jgi:hypothetical protein